MLPMCLLSLTLLFGHSIGQPVPLVLEMSANSVSPGEEVIVKCTATSSTASRILSIDGQPFITRIDADRLSVEAMGPTTTWTINPVLPEDAGVYMCVASSQSATDSDSLPQTLVYYFASPPNSIKVRGPFIAWNVPSELDGEIALYQLKVAVSTGDYSVVNKSTTYHMLERKDAPPDLQGDAVVTVQIRAVTEKGYGEWSSEEFVPVAALAVADLIPVLTDLETPRISLIDNSPIISGRSVTFHFTTNQNVSKLECRLAAPRRVGLDTSLRQFHDCSSGTITYTNLVDASYTFHAKATLSAGGEEILLGRKFRPDNMAECTVHLINNGITVSGSSVIVEFNYFADYTRCKLDKESEYRDCNSPYLLTDLSPGQHELKIIPQICAEPFRYPITLRFETT